MAASAATKSLLRLSYTSPDIFPLLPSAASSSTLCLSFRSCSIETCFLGIHLANPACSKIPALRTRSTGRGLRIEAVARPTILVAEKLGEAGLGLLREFANVDCSYNLSPEELCVKISLCDALIVRSGTKVTQEVFEASKGRLKVVGRAGVGIDNVDLQAATESGCLVVNAPTANTVAAAEHGIALLTAMARNVAQADASMKAGK